jgi:murein DD-endopeptidase MepM/ murein hydrolase activator NlpD
MFGPLRLHPGRALTATAAVVACGGLILESPLLGSGVRDNLAEHRRLLGADVRVPPLADTVLVHGVVRSSLYDALQAGAARTLPRPAHAELAWRLADIFEYRVDMSRDLEPGDEVRVVVERLLYPNGWVRSSEVLAARLTVSGSRHEAIRYRRGAYADRWGRSLRATFLRAPLSYRRLSSAFGMRFHPILGRWREHRGLDYAAAAGTPVRSVGDGVVIFAGWKGSYGNLVEVSHPGGVVTRYAHLRGFSRATWPGARVRVGQTVGYVGSTGLSTGPHLHFEMLVNGRYTDPRHGLYVLSRQGPRVADGRRFARPRTVLLAALGS